MLASQSLANNYNRSIKFINMSDGLKINGATPCEPTNLVANITSSVCSPKDTKLMSTWLSSLYYFSSSEFKSSWNSGRPRQSIYQTFRNFEKLLIKRILFEAGVSVSELINSLSYRYDQFGWKMARGMFCKKSYEFKTTVDCFFTATELTRAWLINFKLHLSLICWPGCLNSRQNFMSCVI